MKRWILPIVGAWFALAALALLFMSEPEAPPAEWQDAEGVGATRGATWEVSESGVEVGGVSHDARVARVDSTFFPALQVPIVAGRPFRSEEYVDPGPHGRLTAMLSLEAAEPWFPGADPLGEKIVVDGEPYVIVGIVGESEAWTGRADVLLPRVRVPPGEVASVEPATDPVPTPSHSSDCWPAGGPTAPAGFVPTESYTAGLARYDEVEWDVPHLHLATFEPAGQHGRSIPEETGAETYVLVADLESSCWVTRFSKADLLGRAAPAYMDYGVLSAWQVLPDGRALLNLNPWINGTDGPMGPAYAILVSRDGALEGMDDDSGFEGVLEGGSLLLTRDRIHGLDGSWVDLAALDPSPIFETSILNDHTLLLLRCPEELCGQWRAPEDVQDIPGSLQVVSLEGEVLEAVPFGGFLPDLIGDYYIAEHRLGAIRVFFDPPRGTLILVDHDQPVPLTIYRLDEMEQVDELPEGQGETLEFTSRDGSTQYAFHFPSGDPSQGSAPVYTMTRR